MGKLEVINILAPLHALFNVTVALIFIYQASLGWRIRTQRRISGPPDISVIKRHRKIGPVLTLAAVLGVFSGWALVVYQYGALLQYPLHSFGGGAIALLLIINFYLSQNIKGSDSSWRTYHFMSGLLLLCLYVLQIFLGIRIFF